MPSITLEVPKGSPLHVRIMGEVRRRVRFAEGALSDRRDKWRKAENATIAYVPESAADARRRVGREVSGTPAYTTVKIPYSYGMVMSYWTYLSSVFLAREPIYQFEGLHGESQQQSLMVEALHAYQMRAGKHVPVLFRWLYDLARYGCGITAVFWHQDIRHVSEIGFGEADSLTGERQKMQRTLRLPGYQGNKLRNVAPRDFLFDPRVPMSQFQEGEFCGTREKLSWVDVKQREAQGYYTNVGEIDPGISPRFPGDVGDDSQVERPEEVLAGFGGEGERKRRKPDIVPVYEVYVELIPSDWELGKSDYPEKWVFTVTADFGTVLGAQPFSAYHAQFPYALCELEPDAYALSNRGIPEIIEGVQHTMDWLINSHMYNVRQSLNNLLVVDPERIIMKDLTEGGPGGLVRRRPGSTNLPGNPVEQIPIQDVTRAHLSDFQALLGIGERTGGVSDQMMGATQRTGRKTATEMRISSVAGASRQKVIAEYVSSTGWGELGGQMIANSQQYFDDELMLPVLGNLTGMAGVQTLRVSPQEIAGAYKFAPVDGTLPIDQFAKASLWKELLGSFQTLPDLAAQYDVGKIFGWIAQLSGIRNIDQFRVELKPDEVLEQEAQQGNIVPMDGNPMDGNPEMLRQIPGVGPVQASYGGV